MIHKKIFELKKKLPALEKDKSNHHSRYASLTAILEILEPLMEEAEIVCFHTIKENKLITNVIDLEDDSKIESEIEITNKDPQKKGGEITYYRRYNIVSIFNLKVKDDDGARASDIISNKTFNYLSKLVKSSNIELEKDLKDLKESEAISIINSIEEKELMKPLEDYEKIKLNNTIQYYKNVSGSSSTEKEIVKKISNKEIEEVNKKDLNTILRVLNTEISKRVKR